MLFAGFLVIAVAHAQLSVSPEPVTFVCTTHSGLGPLESISSQEFASQQCPQATLVKAIFQLRSFFPDDSSLGQIGKNFQHGSRSSDQPGGSQHSPR